jgi:hypothetical protein
MPRNPHFGIGSRSGSGTWVLIVQAVAWLAIKAAFLVAVLFYVAGFTALQAATLTILMIVAGESITRLRTRTKLQPFWVHVKPHLRELLIDHGAIDDAEWKNLCKECDQHVTAIRSPCPGLSDFPLKSSGSVVTHFTKLSSS